jgi:hypothetical protein
MVEILGVVGLGLQTFELDKVVEKKSNVPTMRNPPPPPKKEIKNSCDCFLDGNGLLRRGKIRCIKPKSEHKF